MRTFSLTISPPLVITTAALNDGKVGQSYTTPQLAATGGTGPYTWSCSPSAFAGLSCNPAGLITGTPAVAGAVQVLVTVTDAGGAQASKAFTFHIAVATPPSITTASLPNGTVGQFYAATLAATGGSGPYAWSCSPPVFAGGLSCSPGGAVAGTPAAAGPVQITVTVTDSAGATAGNTFSFTINAALTITTGSLLNGTAGQGYSATLAAAGGSPPYAWTCAPPAFGSGLSCTPDGTVTGMPKTAGPVTVTATVTDAGGLTASKTFTFTMNPATPLAIATGSLPDGTVGQAYTATLAAAGGTGPYAWSCAPMSFAGGLSCTPGGVITGTPAMTGPVTVTVTVTDATGITASRTFTFAINAGGTSLTITTGSLPAATAGQGYTALLSASGGSQPYSWSCNPPIFAGGVHCTPDGNITGMPNTTGTVQVVVTVTDAAGAAVSKTFNVTVNGPAALAIATATLPDGAVGQGYTAVLSATGGTQPYTWSCSPQAFAGGGLGCTAGGTITGKPNTAGPAQVAVTVTDSTGATATRTFNFTISGGAALAIVTTRLSDGTVGQFYSQQLAATGGTGPYTWTCSPPAMAGGLSCGSGGAITGTPAQAGPVQVTVTVADSTGATASRVCQFTINAAGQGALTITTASPLPNATAGSPYTAQISAAGGTPPYQWRFVLGSLLGWISGIDAGTGIISGTPQLSDAGTTLTFDVLVTDAAGQSITRRFILAVLGGSTGTLQITTVSPIPDGHAGLRYLDRLTATGGSLPYRWSWSGTTPPGLTLDAGSGAIAGAPSATGTFTFTVKVTDSQGATDTKQLVLTVDGDTDIMPAGPQPVVAPMALAADPSHQLLYIANWGAYKSNGMDLTESGALPTNMVTVMDENTGKIVNSFAIGNTAAGDSLGIAADPVHNRVYVTNRGDATLSIIDTARNSVSTAAVGASPAGVAVDPATGTVYVANKGDQTVSVLDSSGRVMATAAVDGNPTGVVFDARNQVAYVGLNGPAQIAVLKGGARVAEAPLSGFTLADLEAMAVDPGSRLFVSIGNGTIAVYDITGIAPAGNPGVVTLGTQYVDGLAFDPAAGTVYATATLDNKVCVFAETSTQANCGLDAGRSPAGIAIDPGMRRGFVANTFANSIGTIDLTSGLVTSGNVNTITPSGIAFDSASRRLFAGNWEADALAVLDPGAETVLGNWPTKGHKPWAVALDPDLRQAYVLNSGDGGSLSIMDMTQGAEKVLIPFPQPNPGVEARNGAVAVSPGNHKVYAATGTNDLTTLLEFDGSTGTYVKAIDLGDPVVSGVAVDDNQGVAWAITNFSGVITAIRMSDDHILGQWNIHGPGGQSLRGWQVAADSGRGMLYVTIPRPDPSSFTGVIALDANLLLSQRNAVRWQAAAPDHTNANAIVVIPASGDVCYTALNEAGPRDSVVCLEPSAGAVTTTAEVGSAGDTETLAGFLAVDPTSDIVYVTNMVGGSIQIVRAERSGRVWRPPQR